MIDSFDEFCEGWIGGMKGSKAYERKQLFSIENLQAQYDQHIKLKACLISKGVMLTYEQLEKIKQTKLNSNQENK